MNVRCKIALIFGIFLVSSAAWSSTMDSCLADARNQKRVIDQRQATEECFHIHAVKLSKNQCDEAIKKSSLAQKNPDLQESLNSTCFYQSRPFHDVKSCLAGAEKLKLADNHDEAVFECYQIFQSRISQSQCIEISRKLIYPNKKNYMLRHCQNNY